jgi:hypothetical protein
MSQEHRPLKSRSKGCARKSSLLNRTPYANHESPQFTQAFLDGIAATSALIFAVAGAQCFVAAGLSPGRPLKTPPRSAQTRPPWLGRPLTVRVPTTVAFAWCGTTKTVGNNAPGTAACQSPLPLRAAAPRGAYADAQVFVLMDGRVCICVQRRHGGLTPPALVLRCECLPAKKRFLQCTNARAQERRASARRGSVKTFMQTGAQLLRGPPSVCVPITIAIACGDTTGGLRPPLLCCDANVCRGKNDFCDAQTHMHRSGGCQPAVACDANVVR